MFEGISGSSGGVRMQQQAVCAATEEDYRRQEELRLKILAADKEAAAAKLAYQIQANQELRPKYSNSAEPRGQALPYAVFVGQLFKCMDTHAASCMHAAAGVSGEAGELLDAIKKYWVYNKPLDRVNIVEELGDIRFYAQALQNLLGITEDEIMAANRRKLLLRYPEGQYSDQAAQARADKQATQGFVEQQSFQDSRVPK